MVALNPNRSSSTKTTQLSQFDSYKSFGSKIIKVVLIILSFLVYVVLIPPFIVLVSPLYIYRLLVIILAKCFKPDLTKIMSPRDAVVGLDDVTKKCLCMLSILCVHVGVPDLQMIREQYVKKVMEDRNADGSYVYRKFKYYYESWLGFAFWKEEDNFKIEKHIRFCEETEALLSMNNNEETNCITEEQLTKVLGVVSTKSFPPKMSPWEILIVRNYIPAPPKLHKEYVQRTVEFLPVALEKDKDRKFALIFRYHHAISDGYSIMKLTMVNWAGCSRDKVPKAPVNLNGFVVQMLTYLAIMVLTPYYHLKQFIIDVDRNFWHMNRNKLTREWHTIFTEKMSLDCIKEIGKVQGVSTTGVLLASFGGAIRKYLIERGQVDKIPKVMRSLAPMPWQGHPMDGLVNHWTLGFLVLPTGYDCPKKRLQVAQNSVTLLKTSPILFTNFATVRFLLSVPSWLADFWATNWMTTAILSNFPGPDFMLKLFDTYPTEDVTFFLPQMKGTASLGIAYFSYNGGFRTAVTIDKAIIPDDASAARFKYIMDEELYNLKTMGALQHKVV